MSNKQLNDQSANEILDIVVDMLIEIEARAEQFPQEDSVEIDISEFLEELLQKSPNHLVPTVRAAIARFVEVAPRYIFVPPWMRERASRTHQIAAEPLTPPPCCARYSSETQP